MYVCQIRNKEHNTQVKTDVRLSRLQVDPSLITLEQNGLRLQADLSDLITISVYQCG